MATFRVIEHLDVVEDIPASFLAVEISFAADTLPFEYLVRPE